MLGDIPVQQEAPTSVSQSPLLGGKRFLGQTSIEVVY